MDNIDWSNVIMLAAIIILALRLWKCASRVEELEKDDV